jgi:type IV pilus assembly protein PilB
MKKPKLGKMLVDAGLLTQAQIDLAINREDARGMRLGEYLCSRGLVREDQLVDLLSRQLNVPRYVPEKYPISIELATLLPIEVAQRHSVVPLSREGSSLNLGMSDPTDINAFDTVEQMTQLEVVPVLCTDREINQLTNSMYGSFAGLGSVLQGNIETTGGKAEEIGNEVEEMDVGQLMNMAEGAPAVRMVSWIVAQAVREGARDIHISPEADYIQLRFRIDGKLREVPAPPKGLHLSIVSRIKILSQLDISVSRIPQDGRFTVMLDNREINVRVSTIPTTHGENLVLRLLDMSASTYSLHDLGMGEGELKRIEVAIQRPYGMILSTGPTGSGKSTSLYAVLKELSRPDINIITVEDPVEYRIPKIRQVQLNTRAGMTFASGLRAILRQDPDIIMVGEIRDAETAHVATQAALTGHRVLSTVHTNDAAGAITRLIDMGVEPFLVSSVLLVCLAQRLVRRVCEVCAVTYTPSPEALDYWKLPLDGGLVLKKAVGCSRCQHTGYRGRTGIFEVLVVDDEIREMIARRVTTLEINRAAMAGGAWRTLKDAAAEKMRLGITSAEEAMAVASI